MNRKELIEQMLKDDPNDPFLHYGLALEQLREDDKKSARITFEHLIDSFPDYLPTYYHLGQLLEKLGHEDQALAIYHKGSDLAGKQRDLKTKAEIDEAIWELED